jgi:hypothetical protein
MNLLIKKCQFFSMFCKVNDDNMKNINTIYQLLECNKTAEAGRAPYCVYPERL